MDVAVLTVAAETRGLGRVREVNEDETGAAAGVAGARANSNGVAKLLVHDDVVAGTLRQVLEVASHVGDNIEDDRGRGLGNSEELKAQSVSG